MAKKIEQIKITYVKVSELSAYALNNKIHPEKQINFIVNSIAEFGFNVPLVIDKNKILITGHGRLEAAKKMGLEEVPVVEKNNLTELQVKKYRHFDNLISEMSERNEENINIELLEFGDSILNELYDFSMNLDPDGLKEDFELPDAEKSELSQMTFTLHRDQKEEVLKAMEIAAKLGPYGNTGNENKNGNALARVCELFNSKDWK